MELLTMREAAKYLKIALRTLERMITRNEFPPADWSREGPTGRKTRLWQKTTLDNISPLVAERQRYNPLLSVLKASKINGLS